MVVVYIDINLDNDSEPNKATIKLSDASFNIKAIIWALKQAGYKDINIIEEDFLPEEARAEMR
jgi:hypothetical protein